MPKDIKLAVVIPCYNTSASCVEVITKALTTADAVLAIDDGSTDDTFAHIEGTGCAFLRLPHNMGKGAALRAGIVEVLRGREGKLGQVFDYILTVDGDGQHDPADIPRFVGKAERDGADLVIGVRNVRLMPPKSKIGNYASRLLFFFGTGRYVADTQSGYRMITRRLAEALVDAISWHRYETEAEMLSKSVALGFSVGTVDIPTIYFDRNRRTHFDPLWDSMRVVAVLSRYVLVSLAVTAVDIAAFLLLLAYATTSVVAANVGARTVAVAAHFLLSREYAFRVQGRFRAAELGRYLLTVVANLGVTTWLLVLFERAGLSYLSAKIVAQVIGFAFTFAVLEQFVFRRAAVGRTDWDKYYVKPVATAGWSRRIMENELVRLIGGLAPSREPLRVLELGGGNSCFLPRLMAEFKIDPFTILDSSPEGIRLARERFDPLFAPRVRYAEADAFTAELEGRFDVVFSVGLIEHFDDDRTEQLVGLHRRWVADDGVVLIAVPTPTVLYRSIRSIWELLGLWRFPDERPIPRAELVQRMRRQGLEVKSERTLWSQLVTQAVVAGAPSGVSAAGATRGS